MSNELKNYQEPSPTQINERDFPSLYQAADQSSFSAQRLYLRLQKCQIGALILGSIGSAIATTAPVSAVTGIYAILAIVLVFGVVMNWVSRTRGYDRVWFDCRAVAESTKTATWLFMMKASPFEDDVTAVQSFIDRLRQIRMARPSSPIHLASSQDSNKQNLSDFIKDIRTKPIKERRIFYVESRIRYQKVWYSNKATFNSRREEFWFWTMVILQLLGVAFAVLRVQFSSLPVSIVPVLITCAAAALAWSQMKRFSELAQSYFLAAQELGDQEAITSDDIDEDTLLNLVEQVEETISREHTMWCARRRI